MNTEHQLKSKLTNKNKDLVGESLLEGSFLGGGMSKFFDGGENPVRGGKALPLLLHSQYICCKYITEDRENPLPCIIL